MSDDFSETPVVDPSSHEIDAVNFTSERDRFPTPVRAPLAVLMGSEHLVRPTKAGTPAFSPVTYVPGGTRARANVEAVNAVMLDLDHLSQDEFLTVLVALEDSGLASVAVTTWSHDGDNDCSLRVGVLTTRSYEPERHAAVLACLERVLGVANDPATKDPSRIWFVASCPPERKACAEHHVFPGHLFDVDTALNAPSSSIGRAETSAENSAMDAGDSIVEGARNSYLFKYACRLQRTNMSPSDIGTAVRAANQEKCRPPLESDEVNTIVTSAGRYREPEGDRGRSRGVGTVDRPLTDAGNAERLAAAVEDRFCFVHTHRIWRYYDGKRWVRDSTRKILKVTIDEARRLSAEAGCVRDPDRRQRLERHAMAWEAKARLTASVDIAEALLPKVPMDFDRDPLALNVLNGTLDLETQTLRPHSPADFITRMVETPYDPRARCPTWERFLVDFASGDLELVRFLQKAVGYCLSGLTNEQVLFILFGEGNNGKTTFMNAVSGLLGDYAYSTPVESFVMRAGDGPRSDLARLHGGRLVSSPETNEGQWLNESLVKQLTGEDKITARFLYKELFEFLPEFKIWILANHLPRVRGRDRGIWRRFHVVPCEWRVPSHRRDRWFASKLRQEREGMLAWAVEGFRLWREEGLDAPRRVLAASRAYEAEMDSVAGFLEDCCVLDATSREAIADLYTAYSIWCDEEATVPALSKRRLSETLDKRGFESFHDGQRRGRTGLRLLDDWKRRLRE